MSNTKEVRPFGIRDKVGYMFGDLANDFSFIFASTYVMVFYTKVMGISTAMVGTMFLIARCIDAFTDVGMGRIVDSSKPTKNGRIRPWILRMCGFVALASFLMYQSFLVNAPYGAKVAYMFVTYILWGSIFYTSINIPYGSMASAISADPKDRAELSTWRTIGSTLAGLVIGVGTPMVAYVTVNGQTVLSGSRMTIIAGVFSVCAILCYLLCFNLVRERVDVPANNSKMDIGKMLKSVFTNRALLGIIAAALFLLLAMLTMQGMAGYVFPNFYGSAAAQSTASLLSSVLILLVCAPFASKLANRFGKKELATVSCIVATVLEVICFVLKPTNVWVYVGFFCAAFICLGFFNTIIWAMITDVIDDSEVRNGIREDGTIYAVYSFARKLGQAFSSGLTGGLLTMIGYSAATAFDPEVTMCQRMASISSSVSSRPSQSRRTRDFSPWPMGNFL